MQDLEAAATFAVAVHSLRSFAHVHLSFFAAFRFTALCESLEGGSAMVGGICCICSEARCGYCMLFLNLFLYFIQFSKKPIQTGKTFTRV
jgi:hypothetical protein